MLTLWFFRLLIPVVDTWFGIAVHPATITQLSNTTTDAYHSFGRHLDPADPSENQLNCANGTGVPASSDSNEQSFWWPCNMFIATPHLANIFLEGAQAASAVELDQPSINTLSNYTGPAFTPLSSGTPQDNHTLFFMGDQRSSKNVDFRARTMGITTQCEIATQKCDSDNGTAFQCSAGFTGNFTSCQPNEIGEDCSVGIGFSPDAQLSSAAGNAILSSGSNITALLQQNPMYFATWASGYPAAAVGSDNPLWSNMDPQVFAGGNVYAQWLLNCSATIYDVDYTFVNGTLHTIDAEPAGPEWGAFYSAPFAWQWLPGLTPVKVALVDAAYLASYTAQNSTDLANIWAREFSKNALAMSIGVFVPLVNELEQVRNNNVNVTRVPMVPLYLLLGLKFIYVIVVIFLAIGVYCFTHPAETEVVKAQLSVKGLVAAHFDQPDLLRGNVVKEVQSRLEETSTGATGDGRSDPSASIRPVEEVETGTSGSSSLSKSTPATDRHETRVGIVPTPEGAWKFALVINGAWQSVKPIVKDIVLVEAKQGNLGAVGEDYAAWK